MGIKVSPRIHLPRTFQRFCDLIIQLFQKSSIKGNGSPLKLMKLIRGPITHYFPEKSIKFGLSFSAKDMVQPEKLFGVLPEKSVLVFVVGSFSHGRINVSYTDRDMYLRIPSKHCMLPE